MLWRLFDILLSLFGLICLLPILILCSFLVCFDSGFPIFYRQKRMGRNFKTFRLWKFRTMTNGSDKKGLITIGGNDTRVTQSGIYLRKFKLDEIPQLFNVLIGDMSLVGPRPEVSKYVSIYESEYSYLLKVRPGITSPASLHFSNENELLSEVDNPTEYYEKAILPQKIDLDKSCVNDRGVRNYFSIIFETINKLIGGNK